MRIIKQKGWAIKGIFGFYTGWWLTRKEAIYNHTKEKGFPWSQCRSKGDKVVKIIIEELND